MSNFDTSSTLICQVTMSESRVLRYYSTVSKVFAMSFESVYDKTVKVEDMYHW